MILSTITKMWFPLLERVQTPLLNLSEAFLTPASTTQQNLSKKKTKKKTFLWNRVRFSDVVSLWNSELQHWVTSCEELPKHAAVSKPCVWGKKIWNIRNNITDVADAGFGCVKHEKKKISVEFKDI